MMMMIVAPSAGIQHTHTEMSECVLVRRASSLFYDGVGQNKTKE